MKKKVVILTGAGISKESGISTFRDSNGMWEQYDVKQVATIQGWNMNQELVTRFYNERRLQLSTVEPNSAHKGLKDLEEKYDVTIITQNVDDLHERAGSKNIIHLHGELTKICNEAKERVTYIGYTKAPEYFPDGEFVRPFIVWFGEPVPMIDKAAEIVFDADILVVIGTSCVVYPAAGLIECASDDCEVYIINPEDVQKSHSHKNLVYIQDVATKGVELLKEKLMA